MCFLLNVQKYIWEGGGRLLKMTKNFYILSLSTHGLFLQAKGQGYMQGLQAWAGASKGAKTPKK